MERQGLERLPGLADLEFAVGHEDEDTALLVLPFPRHGDAGGLADALASDPVMVSMPGECSAPIISTTLPSLLNWASPSSAMRPVSMSAA